MLPRNSVFVKPFDSPNALSVNDTLSPDNAATPFTIGANVKIVGKCSPEKLSYAGAFTPMSVDESGLVEHIGKGHPWMPALLGGDGKRKASNVIGADLLALDFDKGLTIQQALDHPFIAEHAFLLIESASSTPELEKFRIVFRLPQKIRSDQHGIYKPNSRVEGLLLHAENAGDFYNGLNGEKRLLGRVSDHGRQGIIEQNHFENGRTRESSRHEGADNYCSSPKPFEGTQTYRVVEAGLRYLLSLFPQADQACKDASRYFFGAPGRKPILLNEAARLPHDFLQKVEAWGASIRAKEAAQREGKRLQSIKWLKEHGENEQIELVRSALEAIAPYYPGGQRYPELFTVMAGVLNDLGPVGERLLLQWDGGAGQWGCDFAQKLKGIKPDGKAGLGSLFWLAAEEGWVRPSTKVKTLFADYLPETTGDKALQPVVSSETVVTSGNRSNSKSAVTTGSDYRPNWVCDQKYLGKLPLPAEAKLVGIKAPKGSGKTTALESVVAEAIARGQRVLIPSHRVQLAKSLSAKLGVPTIYDIKVGDAPDEFIGMALCVHSLHSSSQAHFNAENWEGALVVIDEAEQVVWELLSSTQVKNDRVAILRAFRDLLKNAGRVIVLDADLSDITLDLLTALMPGVTPWLGYKPDTKTTAALTSYERPEMLIERIDKALDAGERVFITVDSQKAKSRFGTIALEKRLRARYPTRRILRIDKDTLAAKDSPAFDCIERVNEVVTGYDIVVVSPSIGSGVSIDVEHFNRVFGLFLGVTTENATRQALARVRQPVPREVYLAPRGLSFIGSGLTDALQIRETSEAHVKAALRLIFVAGCDSLKSNFMPAAVEAFSRYAARQNQTMHAYRDSIHAALADEGYEVRFVAKPDKNSEAGEALKGLSEQLSAARTNNLDVEAVSVATASDLDPGDFDRLKKEATVADEAEAQALKKAWLGEKYPQTPITPDLHVLDSYGWHDKLRLHYFLTLGRQHLRERDTRAVEALINGDAVWGEDVKRSTLSLKVRVLEMLKIPELLELETVSNEHPAIVALDRVARQKAQLLRQVFKFSIKDDDSPVVIARKFLKLVGFKLGKSQRIGPRGQQVRHYPVELEDHKFMPGFVGGEFSKTAKKYQCDRLNVFEAWLLRDAQPRFDSPEAIFADYLPETTEDKALQPVVSSEMVVTSGNRSISKSAVTTKPEAVS